MKILLSCFACEPGQGSEEGVGWNVAVQSARYNEVWVITREFCRAPIEAELRRNPIPNLHFIYVEPFGWQENFKGRQGGLQLHYYLWQILAYRAAQKLHPKIGFDLTRHVTYVKFWSPSLVCLLPVPFIWGPIGGGEAAPKAFWRDFSTKGKLYETARELAQRIGELDPLTRLTARRSVFTPVTTEDTAKRARSLGAKNVQIYSAVGLTKEAIAQLERYPLPDTQPIRFISIGRLLHWKGYHLSISAFVKASQRLQQMGIETEYWLLGDGPDHAHLEAMTQQMKCRDNITFWGRVSPDETLRKLGECHVLLHPSLHDSGGWTCLEAMAAGRPVLCLALGGPDTLITEEAGIKVPARDPDQAVRDLAESMVRLANDAPLREQLGQGGKKRVREVYDWDVKGEFFAQLYERVKSGAGF
jgi:glycosyltransferase involved in cell wall biosynthesis